MFFTLIVSLNMPYSKYTTPVTALLIIALVSSTVSYQRYKWLNTYHDVEWTNLALVDTVELLYTDEDSSSSPPSISLPPSTLTDWPERIDALLADLWRLLLAAETSCSRSEAAGWPSTASTAADIAFNPQHVGVLFVAMTTHDLWPSTTHAHNTPGSEEKWTKQTKQHNVMRLQLEICWDKIAVLPLSHLDMPSLPSLWWAAWRMETERK